MSTTRKRRSVSPATSSPPPVPSPSPSPSPSDSQPPPLPSTLDPNQSPFILSSPSHNLLLTLLTQSHHTPHPWLKCHKCGKWRKLPPTLSGLSPMLPALPLTLSALASLSSPFLPFPFTCAANHWDIDRQVCGAIQDYQDLVYEWKQVPLKFVRAVQRMDFYIALAHFLRVKGVTISEYPCIYGKAIDLFSLYSIVWQAGGDEEVTRKGQWGLVYKAMKLPNSVKQPADVDYLAEIYRSYFFEWQAEHKVEFANKREEKQGEGEEEEGREGEDKEEERERKKQRSQGREAEEKRKERKAEAKEAMEEEAVHRGNMRGQVDGQSNEQQNMEEGEDLGPALSAVASDSEGEQVNGINGSAGDAAAMTSSAPDVQNAANSLSNLVDPILPFSTSGTDNLNSASPSPPHLSTLSSRGQRACQPLSAYWHRFIEALATPYTPANPSGHVLLCVAENKLNWQAWKDKISTCRTLTDDTGAYSDMRGTLPLRSQLASLMSRRLAADRQLSIDPSSICISNGAGAALQTLSLLLCEPGDAILIPSPCYAAFANDLSVAASALPVCVRTEEAEYRLRVEDFERALKEFNAEAEVNWRSHPMIDEGHFGERSEKDVRGITVEEEDRNSRARCNKAFERMNREQKRVRAILLTNPHNPLGLVYEENEVNAILRWAGENGLHVIMDEIYSNTIFNPLPVPQFPTDTSPSSPFPPSPPSSPFLSTLHHLSSPSPPIPPHYLHIIQGLSKDFGLSGYRLAWTVTVNQSILQAWNNLGYFASVSNDVQCAITNVLSDPLWTDEYLYRNCELLREHYTLLTSLLDGSHESIGNVEGDDPAFSLPFLPAVAGMFVWLDLRGFVPAQEEKGRNVWEEEEKLFDLLVDEARVVLTPGHAQGASEVGWFRVCFAWVEKEALIEGIGRMRRVLYKRRVAMV